jgi:outer membrane protein
LPRPEARRRASWRLAVVTSVLLAGCNDTSDLAPVSPDTPWRIERQTATPAESGPGAPPRFAVPADPALPWHDEDAGIDPAHAYSLVELIDIAQRRNEGTRIAWEQARQAAIGVGIARAAYLPELVASALGGYQHVASPFPSNLVKRGYIEANTQEVFPELAIRYLLLDFGRRDATEQQAGQLSFAANVAFTGAHQALILAVARAYFTLDGVDAQLAAARQALANARTLQQSAEAMQGRGLGTVVDTQFARRGTAQAQFDVTAAVAAQHDAVYALLEAMSLPPMTRIVVQDSSGLAVPRQTVRTVDQLMREALRQRPDLLADLARLRAADAGIALARAEFRPTLSLDANVQGNIGRIRVDNMPYQGVEQPQAGVFLHFDWPLYQGGLRENRLRVAQSQRAEAEDALEQQGDQALRQVALAYDQLGTGLDQYEAAVALQSASLGAFDAANAAFAHGVGTFTDAAAAQTALAASRAGLARAHAQLLINAAALAFATGDLTSSAAPGLGATP